MHDFDSEPSRNVAVDIKHTNAKHILKSRTNANNMNLIYDEAMHALPLQEKRSFVVRLLYPRYALDARVPQRNYTKYFWDGRWFIFIQVARDFRNCHSKMSWRLYGIETSGTCALFHFIWNASNWLHQRRCSSWERRLILLLTNRNIKSNKPCGDERASKHSNEPLQFLPCTTSLNCPKKRLLHSQRVPSQRWYVVVAERNIEPSI